MKTAPCIQENALSSLRKRLAILFDLFVQVASPVYLYFSEVKDIQI
jgi:hypothetical protein